MLRRTALLTLVLCCSIFTASGDQRCGVRQDKTRSLITAGHNVQPGDYPWHAAIYQVLPLKHYICGGTLVGQSVVITSAHCVAVPGRRVARSIDELVVQLGKHLLNVRSDSEQEYGLSSIIVHEGFTGDNHGHDVALLITKGPVRYGKFVQPACLPTFSLANDRVVGTIVGWGYTEQSAVSNSLKAAGAPIVTQELCRSSNLGAFGGSLTEEMFCAGYRNGTNACNGDSGGGLFRNVRGSWFLLGIVSFTAAQEQDENRCSSTDYTAFVDVAKYKRWIRNNSGTNVCNGDSGGGMFVNRNGQWFLIGVVSFTAARDSNTNLCSTKDYTGFTKVSAFQDFIVTNCGLQPVTERPAVVGGGGKQKYFHATDFGLEQKMNWFQAGDYCRSIGQHLAEIRSGQDQAKVKEIVAKGGMEPDANGVARLKQYWIGANDLGVSRDFKWQFSGRGITFTHWRQNEPNNVNNNEHCVAVLGNKQAFWIDANCKGKRQVLCEVWK